MGNKEISIINGIGLNGSLVRKHQLKQYRFRLAGVPPDKAIRLIIIGKEKEFK